MKPGGVAPEPMPPFSSKVKNNNDACYCECDPIFASRLPQSNKIQIVYVTFILQDNYLLTCLSLKLRKYLMFVSIVPRTVAGMDISRAQ